METDELYLEIRILITVLAKKALRALEQHLHALHDGITGLQFGIVRALSCQEQTISELSDRFMLDPSTLVPAVDALERKGLAKRGRDPNDRRRIPLSLTERGFEVASQTRLVGEDDPLVQSLKGMDENQRDQLLQLLRDLIRHMPEGEEILHHVASRVSLHTEHQLRLQSADKPIPSLEE